MEPDVIDLNRELMLDGNAVGGLLREMFALEMTACPCKCAHCGREGPIGTLLAFTHAPGVVLRCPGCEQVVLRLLATADTLTLDARGAAHLRMVRQEGDTEDDI
jgi:Family of unknown function (DUF6510)